MVDSERAATVAQVLRVTTAVGEQYYEAASAVGLTVQEARLLFILSIQPTNMLGLTAALDVPKSTMTGLIARLEADGLVEREQDPRDRRHLLTTPTAKGKDAASTFARDLATRVEGLLSAVDERERAELADILNAILVGLEP